MEANYKIVVVTGIHWDRSWKYAFQSNRIKLVECIDRLIEVLNEDYRYASFTFGGQSISIEDYLEIRPHMEKELRRFIQSGRIIAGPWYTLPDTFLVSSESLIRNLMMGHILSERFGGVMKVGYIPDSTGQISQLPQILQGFNIDSAIFTQGMGDEGEKLGSEFIWYSSDNKTRIVAIHHIPIDYNLDIFNSNDVTKKISYIIDNIKDFIRTSNILLNGDNGLTNPLPKTTDIIEYVNEQLDKAELIHGGFSDYIESVKLEEKNLLEYKGELRGSRYQFLLNGVLSSRLYIKQANEIAQTLMEKWVEPFNTINWLETENSYPNEFIWYAWKELLKNHSHNNIRGCSVDEVHREDMVRYDWVKQLGERLINSALDNISNNIVFPAVTKHHVIIFNPLAWERLDPVTLELDPSIVLDDIIIRNADGETVPSQIEQDENGIKRISFDGKIPALGYATYFFDNNPEKYFNTYTNIKIGSRLIENQYYRIKINANGSLDILDKSTGVEYKQCNTIEDCGDGGNGYDYLEINHGKIITNKTAKANIRIIENGPVKVTVEIKLSLNLPKEITKDRENRVSAKLSCNIITNVTIYANYPRIDFVTIFENKISDHRLRVMFPTDIKTDIVNVDGHFDVLKRSLNTIKTESDWVQEPLQTNHQGIFLDVSDDKKGFALINKGLPEYEVHKSKNSCKIYLTLLRCFGWLSRNQFIDSENFATPEAQCHGTHKFVYSLIPHKGNWESARIMRMAYEHNVPTKAVYGKAKSDSGILSHTQSFFSLEPPELILSALKKSELGNGVILRLYNPTDKIVDGIIKTHKIAKSARLTNMNEEPLLDGNLEIDDEGIIHLNVSDHEIKTVELYF